MATMNTKNKTLITLDKDSSKEYKLEVQNKNSFVYEGKPYEINVETSEEGITFINVNGKTYPVEILSSHQNEYEVLVNGISYSSSIETPFSLERLKSLTEQKNQSTVIRLKAPMPGKILEVLVKAGDIVKAGDTLLILEAMKMQNAILASCKAVVKKVLVKDGETTSKSDLLIELEKEL